MSDTLEPPSPPPFPFGKTLDKAVWSALKGAAAHVFVSEKTMQRWVDADSQYFAHWVRSRWFIHLPSLEQYCRWKGR